MTGRMAELPPGEGKMGPVEGGKAKSQNRIRIQKGAHERGRKKGHETHKDIERRKRSRKRMEQPCIKTNRIRRETNPKKKTYRIKEL